MGWEIVAELVPVAVDLDTHRDVLVSAAEHDLDFRIDRSEHTGASEEERGTARTNRALLESLLTAIEGEA